MCLALEPLKKTLQGLCKNLAKSLDFRNIWQNSSVFALHFVGVNALLLWVVQKLWKIREITPKYNTFLVFFAVLRKVGLIQDVLVKTCQLPVVQGGIESFSVRFHKHFHRVENHHFEQMKMSKHKKGALKLSPNHQYDWNFHKMIGYMLSLDGSVKDDKELDTLSEHELSCEFNT